MICPSQNSEDNFKSKSSYVKDYSITTKLMMSKTSTNEHLLTKDTIKFKS